MQLQTHGIFQKGEGGGGCKCFQMHSPTPTKGVDRFFCWTKYICTFQMHSPTPTKGVGRFLAVQDSSIGDNVSH